LQHWKVLGIEMFAAKNPGIEKTLSYAEKRVMIYDVLVESWSHVQFKRGPRLLLVDLRSLTEM